MEARGDKKESDSNNTDTLKDIISSGTNKNSPKERQDVKEQQQSLQNRVKEQIFYRIVYRLSWISLFYIAILPIWLRYSDKILNQTLKWIASVLLLIILLLPSLCAIAKHKLCPKSTPAAKDITALEKEFTRVRKARLEERFFWIFILLIVFNIYILPQMQTWSAPIIMGILELFFIMVCGTVLGVDHIYTIITRLVEKWKGGSVK